MAKIIRKEEPKKSNVIITRNHPSDSIQNYKLLPKCMIPRKKKYINSPG